MKRLISLILLYCFLGAGCAGTYGETLNRWYGLNCSKAALEQNHGRCIAAAKKGS